MARSGSLARYHAKRDFHKTPEPAGVVHKKAGYSYLIQKHAATRLHYDFRLELDGVLKSWAVTRGPSLDPNDKRLAVEVEDHPLEYGGFEGIIPKGQYGGGTVMLWDRGSWEPIGDPHKGLKDGKLTFKLYGERLHGEWTLVRMRLEEKGKPNWLLIKHTDEEAQVGDNGRLLEANMTSVVSGRTMEEIADERDRIWQSNRAEAWQSGKQKQTQKPTIKAPIKKAKRERMPGFIPPQLATLATSIPTGTSWVHEIKFDGYRMLAYIEKGKVRLLTRSGLDWTPKFAAIAKLLEKLLVENAILDGEMVVPDENGVSSFHRLKETLMEGSSKELQYYVFDLLFLDGENLMRLPLLERKRRLEPLLKVKSFADRIIYSEHFAEQDRDFLQRVCNMRLEGVVSKSVDASYLSGRGKAWLKTKCHMRQEFVIGGYTLPTREGPGIGAMLLGYYEEEQLVYAGKVGTGLDRKMSQQMRKMLDARQTDKSPFVSVPADGRRGARWVKPDLVCEVEFTEWTGDGRLRHPSFQGLREDKPARDIKRDKPVITAKIEKERKVEKKMAVPAKKTTVGSKDAQVGGIRISHPDRVIYPGTDITKQNLAEYYLAVAERILPYIAQRPLSMVRCPEGSGEPCFFQRHIARGQSEYLHEVPVTVKGKKVDYLMIRDLEGLLSLVQWGVIELHPWGCRADQPNKPDYIIFDLDPDPGATWQKVMQGALEVRERMQEFGLESFLKTTGGKGLHVMVPLERRYTWVTIKAFARAIAVSMASDSPDSYTATLSKSARKGKVFVDYLRNELTATAIAPYSARAREGATVATPLFWKELDASGIKKFTIETIIKRLRREKTDPWKDATKLRQSIPRRVLQALKIPIEE